MTYIRKYGNSVVYSRCHYGKACEGFPKLPKIYAGISYFESEGKEVKKQSRQTWNLSQAPQACLCKILLVRVKCLAIHTLFLSQLRLVCVQILGVELTRVSLHYK